MAGGTVNFKIRRQKAISIVVWDNNKQFTAYTEMISILRDEIYYPYCIESRYQNLASRKCFNLNSYIYFDKTELIYSHSPVCPQRDV